MRAIILLSAIIGIAFAIPTLIILLFILPEYALQISLLAGCFAFILMSIFLAIHVALDKRKYDRFESKIRIPVFCKVNGNFRVGKKVRNGNVYFCEEGVIIIALLDEKPYIRETLLLSDVEKISVDGYSLLILMKDGKEYSATVPTAAELETSLAEKGWIENRFDE